MSEPLICTCTLPSHPAPKSHIPLPSSGLIPPEPRPSSQTSMPSWTSSWSQELGSPQTQSLLTQATNRRKQKSDTSHGGSGRFTWPQLQQNSVRDRLISDVIISSSSRSSEYFRSEWSGLDWMHAPSSCSISTCHSRSSTRVTNKTNNHYFHVSGHLHEISGSTCAHPALTSLLW